MKQRTLFGLATILAVVITTPSWSKSVPWYKAPLMRKNSPSRVTVIQAKFIDTDNDGVKDYWDKCPNTPPGAEVNSTGCPDTDGDGVYDSEDQCPKTSSAGIVDANGCLTGCETIPGDPYGDMNTDSDGLDAPCDYCPQQNGLLQFNGCPDTDADGVPDNDDLCDATPGIKPTGCPDADGDSVAELPGNNGDHCPGLAGSVIYLGCPNGTYDSDGDGVPNYTDNCYNNAFPIVDPYGCNGDSDGDGNPNNTDICDYLADVSPTDADGDGVPNASDACDCTAGSASAAGCPDNDGDGVPNSIDQCDDVPGPGDPYGCP